MHHWKGRNGATTPASAAFGVRGKRVTQPLMATLFGSNVSLLCLAPYVLVVGEHGGEEDQHGEQQQGRDTVQNLVGGDR